jgi:hypothetical protein
MTTYIVRMSDGNATATERFDADTDADAIQTAEELTREWVEGGDWGDDGASIDAFWRLYRQDKADRDDGEEIDSGSFTVEIEPDHDALIRRAGGDPHCDHEWVATVEVEGGCRENPGVWSTSGTSFTCRTHCRVCGLRRTEHVTGSQRNPGEHDTVSFEQPDSWCAECQREECGCDGDGE